MSERNIRDMTDDKLLDLTQRQTFRYFWEGAHPVSGFAYDRIPAADIDNPRAALTTGGTGMGVMAIIVAAERGWVSRTNACSRISKIVHHLEMVTERFEGVWPHWIEPTTCKARAFGDDKNDNVGDIIETAFVVQGLLCARQYFDNNNLNEGTLRDSIDRLWREVNWRSHTRGENVLYWHGNPKKDHKVRGWDEGMIAYVLAASSPTYPIDPAVYHEGWTSGQTFQNGETYYGIKLPLGWDYGGPLFFTHYSFLGLDPRGVRDRYADYWEQNVAHTLINREHCVRNPFGYPGYGPGCWGLTASDSRWGGYHAHEPRGLMNDRGVITPTAALGSMPYAPDHSMEVLTNLHHRHGEYLFGDYGFRDSFSPDQSWRSAFYLAIDQGPIVAMIENFRTGLLWELFMSHQDIKKGLQRLGIESPHLSAA